MVYVISDLHGYPVDKSLKLLKQADFSDNDYLYIIGDVVLGNSEWYYDKISKAFNKMADYQAPSVQEMQDPDKRRDFNNILKRIHPFATKVWNGFHSYPPFKNVRKSLKGEDLNAKDKFEELSSSKSAKSLMTTASLKSFLKYTIPDSEGIYDKEDIGVKIFFDFEVFPVLCGRKIGSAVYTDLNPREYYDHLLCRFLYMS